MNTFLGKSYEVPTPQNNYFRFQEGENRFRIMSSAIVGWIYFSADNKPHRSKEAPVGIPKDIKENGKVKHFWSFVCYDYSSKSIKIMEIVQVTIMDAIKALVDSKTWGDPVGRYDLVITRTGEGLETKYSVMPEPHSETSEEIKTAFMEKPVDLNKLFTNDDPFATT